MAATTAKTLADLETEANALAEVDAQSNTTDDLIFEGGELDGVRTTQRKFEKEAAPIDVEAGDAKPDLPEIVIKDVAPAAAETATGEVKESVEGETTLKAADAPEVKSEGAETTGATEYKPNFAYKVYDQEKQFPEWAQKACVDAETETNLRTTFQKSEAFDTLKPKHESVVRERDEARSHVSEHVVKVERLAKLRDKNVDLFLRSMGVTDKQIVDHAVTLVRAEDDAEAARALANQRAQDQEAYQQDLQFESQQQGSNQAFRTLHIEALQQTFSSPEVSSFKARLDAVAGVGSFDRAFALVGTTAHEQEGYVPPREVARRVMEHYGKQLPVVQGTPLAPAPVAGMPVIPVQATSQQAAVAPVVQRKVERPKTIPNVGRGGSASPVRARPRNLDDMQKRIGEELDAIG